jgi:hypothetical protein
MSDSPTEVLARLERYATSVRAGSDRDGRGARGATGQPPDGDFGIYALPAVLVYPAILVAIVSSCVVTISAFVLFGRPGGAGVAAVLTLGAVIGIVRRVPMAGVWLSGVVIGALIGGLS